MSEFSGKKFYGFSMHNDPDLSTSTKNFEFKYMRPEVLEKVIQKVHGREQEKSKAKNLNWYSYCRTRFLDTSHRPNESLSDMKRDVDVDTTMSRFYQANCKKVRNLTENEIEHLIVRARNGKGEGVTKPKCKRGYVVERICINKCADLGLRGDTSVSTKVVQATEFPIERRRGEMACQTEDFAYHGLETDTCTNATSTSSLMETTEELEMDQTPGIIREARLEEFQKPQAHWIEIVESSPKGSRIETQVPNSVDNKSNASPKFDYFNMSLQGYDASCFPAILMNEMVVDNMRLACGANLNPYAAPTAHTLVVEDSDLEFEMCNRPNYTKYCKTRPQVEETLSARTSETQEPTFIEVENKMNMSYIRNASPILFTEITEENSEEHQEPTELNMLKIDLSLKDRDHEEESPKGKLDSPTSDESKPRKRPPTMTGKARNANTQRRFASDSRNTSGSSTPNSAKMANKNRSPNRIQSNDTRKTRCRSKYNKNDKTNQPVDKNDIDNENEIIVQQPKMKTKRLRRKNLCLSKSIEDLKAEKAHIFIKMTGTQERIIEVLDRLRLNLLELNVPENPYDKLKRQKNAFEFSVRFSRNFLYPLKSMVNDLKYTSDDQFTSLTSNDACAKICNIYTLFLQSLHTYQKQLRYFLLDKVPQKLTTLIEMIYNTTNICLEKNIFSNQDMIVDCLQQRVAKFIGFMEDMHEGRLEAARQNYRKLTLKKASPKYDLKMFMNDLNMYEPKLVPKPVPETRTKNKAKVKKQASVAVIIENSQEDIQERPAEDAIATQIEGLTEKRSSVSVVKASPTNEKPTQISPKVSEIVGSCDGDMMLDKQVLQTLQNITKEQVRQVLEPIFDSLGTALGDQNNLEIVEHLVSAFNNKVFSTLEVETKKLANKYEGNDSRTVRSVHTSGDGTGNHNNGNEHTANITEKVSDISKVAEPTETLTQRMESPTQQNDETVDNTFSNNNNNNCNVNKQNENIGGNVMNHSVSSVGDMRASSTTNNKVGNIYKKNNQPVEESMPLRSVEEYEESHLSNTEDTFSIQDKGKKGDKLFSTTNTKCFSSISWPYLNPPDKSMNVEVTTNPSTVSSPAKLQEKSKNTRTSHSNKAQRNFSFCTQQQQKNNVKPKNRYLKKKSKPILELPPPVPVVSPSSSNGSTSDTRACKNVLYPDNGGNLHKSMGKIFPSTQMQKFPNAAGIKDQGGVYCNTHTKKKKKNVIQTALGTSYVELYHNTLPLYENNSPHNTSEDSLQVTPVRACQAVTQLKKLNATKILPKHSLRPPHTGININKSHHEARKTEYMEGTARAPLSELEVDAIIKERNSFLKLCVKNRFYNNPNYNEPWKVFSNISEKILNDILGAVESDFSIGVSKFVEDFLALETKTGYD